MSDVAGHSWYEYNGNLARLWRWLDERGEAPNDPAYFMEKPWKWEAEWDAMREAVTTTPSTTKGTQ